MCFANANLIFLQESAVTTLCKKEFSDEEESQINSSTYLHKMAQVLGEDLSQTQSSLGLTLLLRTLIHIYWYSY